MERTPKLFDFKIAEQLAAHNQEFLNSFQPPTESAVDAIFLKYLDVKVKRDPNFFQPKEEVKEQKTGFI